jgi:hypothetical protein
MIGKRTRCCTFEWSGVRGCSSPSRMISAATSFNFLPSLAARIFISLTSSAGKSIVVFTLAIKPENQQTVNMASFGSIKGQTYYFYVCPDSSYACNRLTIKGNSSVGIEIRQGGSFLIESD